MKVKDRSKLSNLCGAAKGAAILDQNFFNLVGMTEKDDSPAWEAKRYSVSVSL
jgi:hypothetical protein